MDEKTKEQIQQEAAELVATLQPRSGKFRTISPEMDPLRLGSGWTIEDLDKPQVIIESTFGDSHPGSAGLFELVEEVRAGVAEAGGHGARYFCTDICDGEAQGHNGINYSLPSRDMIANMIEIHAKATPFDAGVFVASCDKGLPANLMAMGRVNIPSIVVTGGVMDAGPDLLTLEQLGAISARYERGEISRENLEDLKKNGFYEKCGRYLEKWNLKREDIIRPFDQTFGTDGSIAILHGSLAPEGAVVNHTVVPREMFRATLKARPFDCEEDAIHAVLTHEVKPGDAVIVRYEGPKGSGMPEMFYTTEAIASDPELGASIALITDGRFSGASKGPAIGHVSPELPWAVRLP